MNRSSYAWSRQVRTIALFGSIAVATTILIDLAVNGGSGRWAAQLRPRDVTSLQRQVSPTPQPATPQGLLHSGFETTTDTAHSDPGSRMIDRTNTIQSAPAITETLASVPDVHLQFLQKLSPDDLANWSNRVQAAYELTEQGSTEEGQQQLWLVLQEIAVCKAKNLGDQQYLAGFLEAVDIIKQIAHRQPQSGSFQRSQTADPISESEISVVRQEQIRAVSHLAEIYRQLECGSLALCFLGKIQAGNERGWVDRCIADVYFQAALLADDTNYYAANEYGVFLARHGDWSNARHMFLASNQIQPNQHATQNLNTMASHPAVSDEESATPTLREAIRNAQQSATNIFR